jgi:hypothetical protein
MLCGEAQVALIKKSVVPEVRTRDLLPGSGICKTKGERPVRESNPRLQSQLSTCYKLHFLIFLSGNSCSQEKENPSKYSLINGMLFSASTALSEATG